MSKYEIIDLDNPTEIIVTEDNPISIYFGAKGCRLLIFNDVNIIPQPNSLVNIAVELKGFDIIHLQILESIEIYQRDVTPYPSFLLNIGDLIQHKKRGVFEGTITISGNCILKQKLFKLNDV